MTPATRACLLLSAAMITSVLVGCASGDGEALQRSQQEPTPADSRPISADSDTADPAAQIAAQLEGDLESREDLAQEFPDDIPLPAGRLVSSTTLALGGDRPWCFAEVVCSSDVHPIDAMDWYMERLREARFEITDWQLDGESRIVHRGRSYDVKITTTHEDGREVVVCIGEDAELDTLFSIDVHFPAEED